MRVRTLGGDGPAVAVVGIGDVSLALAAGRGVDRGDVTRALHLAIVAGINLIDVRDEADAERLVGEAVRELRVRDRAVVACRVPAVGSAAELQARVEASLRTTRLDAIPLAQLTVRASTLATSMWPELRGTCERLVREGKVLRWGAYRDDVDGRDLRPAGSDAEGRRGSIDGRDLRPAGSDAEGRRGSIDGRDLRPAGSDAEGRRGSIDDEGRRGSSDDEGRRDSIAALVEPLFATVNVVFNACERQALPLLEHATPSVLARRPLAGGGLAGTLGPGVRLTPRDDRQELDFEPIAVGIAKLSAFVKQTPPAARSSPDARAQLERNVRPEHLEVMTVAELALRYAIDQGAIVLPRLHRSEHVVEAIAAAAAPPLTFEVPKLDN